MSAVVSRSVCCTWTQVPRGARNDGFYSRFVATRHQFLRSLSLSHNPPSTKSHDRWENIARAARTLPQTSRAPQRNLFDLVFYTHAPQIYRVINICQYVYPYMSIYWVTIGTLYKIIPRRENKGINEGFVNGLL